MQNLIFDLQQKAEAAIRSAFGATIEDPQLLEAEVTHSTQAQFGHYQCNSALKIGKALKMSPRDAAQKIVAHFNRSTPDGKEMVSQLEIAGPGFINISLSTSFLAAQIDAVLRDSRLGVSLPKKE